MAIKTCQVLSYGIDFSGFDTWWKSANPSVTYQVTQAQSTPVYVDDCHVSIFEWKINVKSRIFEYASSKEVINGWNLIDKNLKILGSSILDLFVPISRLMLIEYNSIMASSGNLSITSMPTLIATNFGIISLLKLAYWHNKCFNSSSTFSSKEVELRQKLSGFVKTFNDSTNQITNKLEKIINDIDDCVSELMFAGLSVNSGRLLLFDDIHDFSINDIPCEVKTIHDQVIIAHTYDGKTVIGSKKEEFGELSLKDEIVEQVMRNKYKFDIKKAVEQGGKIIFIDASFSTVAHDVAAIDYNNDIDGNRKFNQLLQNALQNCQACSSLPVIVGVGSVAFFQQQSFVWYQTYYSFYVPIIIAKGGKVMLDESRYNDYNITNSINVNDVRFKKYPLD